MFHQFNFTFACFVLLCLGKLEFVKATLGVDVNSSVSETTWSCIAENGDSFAIVQAYQSNGEVDNNAVETIKNAKAGGITYVDGYLSPCFTCGNPAGQLSDAIRNLDLNGGIIGQMWLSVTEVAQWSTSCDENVAFIQDLVDEASRLEVVVGIASSDNDWTAITCGSTAFSYLQLWYSNVDGNPSFSDYIQFGGWAKPAIKQYQSDTTLCGVGVNQDFY